MRSRSPTVEVPEQRTRKSRQRTPGGPACHVRQPVRTGWGGPLASIAGRRPEGAEQDQQGRPRTATTEDLHRHAVQVVRSLQEALLADAHTRSHAIKRDREGEEPPKTQPGGASNKRRRRREVPFMTHPAARRLNKAGGRRHKVPTPCDRWRRVDVPPSGRPPGLSRRPAPILQQVVDREGRGTPWDLHQRRRRRNDVSEDAARPSVPLKQAVG